MSVFPMRSKNLFQRKMPSPPGPSFFKERAERNAKMLDYLETLERGNVPNSANLHPNNRAIIFHSKKPSAAPGKTTKKVLISQSRKKKPSPVRNIVTISNSNSNNNTRSRNVVTISNSNSNRSAKKKKTPASIPNILNAYNHNNSNSVFATSSSSGSGSRKKKKTPARSLKEVSRLMNAATAMFAHPSGYALRKTTKK